MDTQYVQMCIFLVNFRNPNTSLGEQMHFITSEERGYPLTQTDEYLLEVCRDGGVDEHTANMSSRLHIQTENGSAN